MQRNIWSFLVFAILLCTCVLCLCVSCQAKDCQNWLLYHHIMYILNVTVLMVLIATAIHTHISNGKRQNFITTSLRSHHSQTISYFKITVCCCIFFIFVVFGLHFEICVYIYNMWLIHYGICLSSMFLTITVERGSSSSYDW